VYASAVERDLYFDNLSLEHGLNQAAVYSLAKDRFGFVWLGTQDGLHRFDGNEIKLVRLSPNKIPKYRYIRALSILNDLLYVATTDGLVVVNLSTGEKFYPNVHGASVYSIARVNDLVWLGTDIGIFELNQSHEIITYYGKRKINAPTTTLCGTALTQKACYSYVRALVFNKKTQTVWIGSDSGLFEFNLLSKTISKHEVDKSTPSSNAIRSLLIDHNNVLWIATFFGLHRLNISQNLIKNNIEHLYPQKDIFDSLPNKRILSIAQDNNDFIWVGTSNGLSRHYNPKTESESERINFNKNWQNIHSSNNNLHSLQDNLIRSILTDNEGRIWVGTDRGISVTNTERNKIEIYRATQNENISNYILSLSEESTDKYWVGTRNGLYVYDLQTTKQIPQLKNNVVYDTLIDSKYVWVATRAGLYKIGIDSQKVKQHYHRKNSPIGDTFIYKLVKIKNQLWLGTTNGLFRLDLSTNKWEHWDKRDGLINSQIYSLYYHQGKLWIGTSKGLSVYNPNSKSFTNYASYNSDLKTGWIFNVNHLVGDDFLIATNGGIYKFDSKREKFDYIGITEGNAYAVVKENTNKFWITSNNGLYSFNPTTGDIQHFNEKHGFASNEYNLNASLKNSRGQLMLGTINGFNIFESSQINNNNLQVKSRFVTKMEFNGESFSIWNESLLTGQKPLLTAKRLLIDWQVADLKLTLSNPYFALSAPKNGTRFSHEESTIDLSRIDSGSYEISLSSIPNNVLSVIKQTHPLKSIWAMVIYILVLLSAIYTLVRFRLTTKFNKELIDKNRTISMQKDEIEQLLSFKQNLNLQIQHSLKSPVFACIGLSTQIERNIHLNKANMRESVERKNKKLGFALNELSKLINEFITINKDDYRQVSKSNQYIISTIKYLESLMTDIATNKGITLNIQIDKGVLPTDAIYSTDKSLYLILENVISNAIKFSPINESVHVSLAKKYGCLELFIKDNGCGLTTSDLDNIFTLFYRGKNSDINDGSGIGLNNAKHLIDELNGQISYTKNSPQGTIVKITLPIMEYNEKNGIR
jgi:ligand-binding sensor domain-containing protein/signal transduction histidine kinase